MVMASAAEEEHHRDRDQVEDGDALVVLGQQPGRDAVRDVQIVLARLGGGGGGGAAGFAG